MKAIIQTTSTIIDFLFNATLTIFKFIFELIDTLLSNNPPKKEGYDAEFLTPSSVMSSYNRGFNLTGIKSITELDSHKHSLVIGSSGTGKSTVVIIPTIYNLGKYGHSICVNDPSGELYQNTSGYLFKLGYKIQVLNYCNPEMSDGYNPLSRVETTSDIYKTATTIVQNSLGKSATDGFWNSQAIGFISLMISVLKKQKVEYQNLANVKHLIDCFQAEPEMLDRIVAGCLDEGILKEYKNMLRMEAKVRSNVISTCRSALMLFNDDSIARVTSQDTIQFDDFRKQPTALFIMNKTSDLKYYSPLTAVFFLQFFNFIMNQHVPDKKTKSIFFIIDELSSLYLPDTFQIALANLRKYRCGIMGAIQDQNQLIHLYGHHEAYSLITNFHSKTYFPGQPMDTARELSDMLGKREFINENGNTTTRVLLTPDEVRTMSENTALIFCGSHQAIFTNLKPFYSRHEYTKFSRIQPPEINRGIIPNSNVELLKR